MNTSSISWIRLAWLAGLLSAMPALAFAQPSTAISGAATDAQGGALPGAVVVALHLPTGTTFEATTGSDGRFSISGVRTGGPYRITVNMAGFASQERRDLIVNTGETLRADFELQLAGVSEMVSVIAGTALARDEKRSAPTIMDVVSADRWGAFQTPMLPKHCDVCLGSRWRLTRAKGALLSSAASTPASTT